jgi:hypothetical protein
MPIRRSQKKRNAEPRQKQNHRRLVIDPMVNPGSSAHRHQARSKADPTRPHHRMVTLAQSPPGDRSACAPQSKTATVMLERIAGLKGANPGMDDALFNQVTAHEEKEGDSAVKSYRNAVRASKRWKICSSRRRLASH